MKQKSEQAASNARVAVIFFAFLILIVGISLIFKIIIVIRNSQFDDARRFTLSITNGRNLEIMSLSPSSKNITVFKFSDSISSSQAGRLLEIPIDGFIVSNSIDLNQKINPLFMNLLFNCNKIKTNFTVIDLLRLAVFTKTISEGAISTVVVRDTSGLVADNVVGNLVNDDLIEKNNQTIQIINGTDVAGLGSRLAKLITNMGGNVILVTSKESLIKKSAITYLGEKTYTVERLRKVLDYETTKEPGNSMADITIIIGEDKVNSLPF